MIYDSVLWLSFVVSLVLDNFARFIYIKKSDWRVTNRKNLKKEEKMDV